MILGGMFLFWYSRHAHDATVDGGCVNRDDHRHACRRSAHARMVSVSIRVPDEPDVGGVLRIHPRARAEPGPAENRLLSRRRDVRLCQLADKLPSLPGPLVDDAGRNPGWIPAAGV